MRRLSATVCILLVLNGVAAAQSSLGIGVSEQSTMPESAGIFSTLFAWVAVQQREFYRLMTDALRAMRDDSASAWVLVSLSFLYGILHAAGPGHGKVVISSYMLANEVQLRRGVMLSVASSILQAMSAIIVVGLGFLVLRQLSVSVTDATTGMEIASYVMVCGLGLWLLARKAMPNTPSVDAHKHHGHDHAMDHHHHHDDGEVCASCGHAHMPSPQQIDQATTARARLGAVLSVGMRPCSGALVVLTFAFMNGLWWAGIASTFAMAMGTAITVSALASMAVLAKNAALRYSGSGVMSARVTSAIEVTGALFILAIGLLLLGGALVK